MKSISVGLLLLSVTLFYQCDAKESSKDANQSANEKQTAKESPTDIPVPSPDTKTFFPLIPKSAWHYNQFMEGDMEPGNSQIDSVIEVTETESGILCKMIRNSNNVIEQFAYLIKNDSIVMFIDNSNSIIPFCSLFPSPEDKIGDLSYSRFLNKDNTSIRLETSDYETATEEQQMEWQAKIFKKGIGLVSFGGSALSMNLTEYHIGDAATQKIEH